MTLVTPVFLNTRPNPMAETLAEMAQEASLPCVNAPIIQTVPIASPLLADAVTKQNDDAKWLFVSRTAVREFAKQTKQHGLTFSPQGEVLAVGPGTRDELIKHFVTIEAIACPPLSNSESLLTLDLLSENYASPVYLVKGENGRELLQNTLADRGFQVHLIDVYQRTEIRYSKTQVEQWLECPIFLATSVEIACGILHNLKATSIELGDKKWLVLSERIKAYLISQGIENNFIFVCEDTDNSSIIKQIKQLAK